MTTRTPPTTAAGSRSLRRSGSRRYNRDLRRDLLDAALVSCVEVGPAQVSLRELARSVGVSHAAPKNHFPDKRALFTVLATEGHHRLGDVMDAALAPAEHARTGDPDADNRTEPAPDPVEQLVAAGKAYLRFAREQPGYFAVMWQEDLQDRGDPDLLEASHRSLSPLLRLSRRLTQQDGPFRGHEPTQVAVLAWALAHGIADLSAGHALDDLPGPQDPIKRDEQVLDLLSYALTGQCPAPFG